MQQSKSSKILNQAKSSIYTFTEFAPLSINLEDKKLAQIRKRSKRSEMPEKSPKEQEKHKTPAKSISGLKSLKIPQKRTEKVENSMANEKRLKDLSPVLDNLPKDLLKKPMMKSSISPKIFRNLSPLNETLIETHSMKKSSILSTKQKNILRHLNLSKELELNQQTLSNPQSFKPKSCLEDIILLGESKELSHFTFIEENLKICTSILRNMIGRLENIGKSNEAVLLDKFWRHIVETIDQTIDAFMSSKKTDTIFNGKKNEFSSVIQHKTQDFESLLKVTDWDLESFKVLEKSEIVENLDFSTNIQKVQQEIQNISRLFEKKLKNTEEAENFLNASQVGHKFKELTNS